SRPAVIFDTRLPDGREKLVCAPEVVVRMILKLAAIQRLPSEPVTMPSPPCVPGSSVMTPAVVILATRPLLLDSVNHRLPSGPTVMPWGKLFAVGIGNSVIVPVDVIRPILLPLDSTNHMLPSGPSVMPMGALFGV